MRGIKTGNKLVAIHSVTYLTPIIFHNHSFFQTHVNINTVIIGHTTEFAIGNGRKGGTSGNIPWVITNLACISMQKLFVLHCTAISACTVAHD